MHTLSIFYLNLGRLHNEKAITRLIQAIASIKILSHSKTDTSLLMV